MVKSLAMALVYCPGLIYQHHSLVDFQLSVKSDSIPFPDSYAKSAKCLTDFCNSSFNFIINVYCSVKSASHICEFINNLQFLSIHSDGWFAVRLSRCWLSHFALTVGSKWSHNFDMRSTALLIFSSDVAFSASSSA